MSRRRTLARKRDAPDVARFERLREVAFWRIARALTKESPVDGLPPLLQEELRKVALV